MKAMNPPAIQFLGATRTVTGSKTCVFAGPDLDDRVMIDCGLFQGPKQLRLRNRASLPVRPDSIGAVLLTHGHLDHCGYLPRMVVDGFAGPVYCTEATAEIARIILMDSAHLQEEEARYANKKGFSKHSPALPLYTQEDALRAIDQFRTVPNHSPHTLSTNITATFHEAGHILGSTSIELELAGGDSPRRILFSGDVGRYGAPILPDPDSGYDVDTVVMESTYGGRFHGDADVFEELAKVVNESIERGGVLLIPAFAVGRTQLLLFALRQLKDQKRIPDIPVHIDSPMAIRVTGTHMNYDDAIDAETRFLRSEGDKPILPKNLHIHRSVDDSKRLNDVRHNAIIISASGMATGGRILHHMANKLPHKEHTLLFIGYQAVGTRGRTILEGQSHVKIHGTQVPVRAAVAKIDGFSAHADHDELLIWLKKFARTPDRVFLNHGEDESLEALKTAVQKELGTKVTIAEYEEKYII
ncbi:MAG TPA: MBL fold metallo-hydrolase [bacterium]|nr:MBL fold metallo-hydrolase [bacterium]